MKYIKFLILSIVFIIISMSSVNASTGFTLSNENNVLVGTNYDYQPLGPNYAVVYPPDNGIYGRICFGFENMFFPQTVINDQGLFYQAYFTPVLEIVKGEGKPGPPFHMCEHAVETCSTVEEVIELYDTYDLRNYGMNDNQHFYVDRFGNSAIIEGDEVILKEGDFQVVTNFYHSDPYLPGSWGFERYDIAVNMLENMNDLSMKYFRDICDATHQYGNIPTLYSIVGYLNKEDIVIHYYNQHNFDEVWVINLTEEFQLGEHRIDISDVIFNKRPKTPNTPDGPTSGKIGESYTFFSSTIDLENDQVFYLFDWDDGTDSGWLGPFDSGDECSASHIWDEKGIYSLRVKAKDVNDIESDWSNPSLISMSKNKKSFHLQNTFLKLINCFSFFSIGFDDQYKFKKLYNLNNYFRDYMIFLLRLVFDDYILDQIST